MPSPPPERRRRRSSSWLAWLGLIALAAFLFRLIGPGGESLRRRIGGSPAGTGVDDVAGRPPGAEDGAPAGPPSAPTTAADDATGRVRFPDGSPAAGASVEARFLLPAGTEVSLRSEPSGADGAFRVAGAPAGWSEVRFEVRLGPLRGEARVTPAAGIGAGSGVRVDLLVSDRFDVGGIVVSSEEGRPLPGISVHVGERRAVSDGAGRFLLAGLERTLLAGPLPPLLAKGEGRKSLSRALDPAAPMDDLLLSLEAVAAEAALGEGGAR